jgi:OmpA-OmpF porin, OOP family
MMCKISFRRLRVMLSVMVLAGMATPTVGTPPAPSQQAGAAQAFEAYSRFDFVPGERVIALEDFAQDSIGDFPAKWNTNASGEIVTIANRPGRWLKLTGQGVWVPEFFASLPENFTLEYDLLVAPNFVAADRLSTVFVELENVKEPAAWGVAENRFHFNVYPEAPDGNSQMEPRQGGDTLGLNETVVKRLAPDNMPVHLSVWRQRQRMRV